MFWVGRQTQLNLLLLGLLLLLSIRSATRARLLKPGVTPETR
jgi:hypothetical protein